MRKYFRILFSSSVGQAASYTLCNGLDAQAGLCLKELRSCCLPLVSTVARTKLANCERDVAISASQAIEGTVITAAAAPVRSVGPISGPATHTARALSASITRAGIW